jgi:hypothetical protein
MEIRPLALIVLPDSETIFCEQATRIEIDDEGAGEFVVLRQHEGGKITIDPAEWPLLRAAINRMVKQCRI